MSSSDPAPEPSASAPVDPASPPPDADMDAVTRVSTPAETFARSSPEPVREGGAGDVELSEVEKGGRRTSGGVGGGEGETRQEEVHVAVDIEHVHVENDPRTWSRGQRQLILALISTASIAPTMGQSIYNPAFDQIQAELSASNAEIALSLSLFILVQGNAPLVWSAVSEIKGRKPVYLASLTLFAVGAIVAAESHSIGVLIGMRVVQAAGASAVLSIGAGTLADIFEPRERGSMLGIYYAAPLLGPSIGPLLGGALTAGFNWRATFWCLVIFAGITLIAFVFFKDTFRKERSLAYRSAVLRAAARASAGEKAGAEARVEGGVVVGAGGDQEEIKLSLRDVNPITPALRILQRWNNLSILLASSLLFSYAYSIAYTAARTFAEAPYSYDSLFVGLVLLSYGVGNVLGSLAGGRWSDRTLARSKAANGGRSFPEMRLKSTHIVMPILPLATLGYAWCCQEKVHVAGPVVCLFFAGFSCIWVYSSTLAYIVDANTGRSSTAVAVNSSWRGTAGFVASEVAVPLQLAIGDGGLYTIWAGLLAVSCAAILVTERWGGRWRESGVEKEGKKEGGKGKP